MGGYQWCVPDGYIFALACATQLLITWSRVTVFDFYQNLNHFYDVVSEFCTVQSCSKMGAASE